MLSTPQVHLVLNQDQTTEASSRNSNINLSESLKDTSITNLLLSSSTNQNDSSANENNQLNLVKTLTQSTSPQADFSRHSRKSSNSIKQKRAHSQLEDHDGLINDILVVSPNSVSVKKTGSNLFDTSSLDSSSGASIYSLNNQNHIPMQNHIQSDQNQSFSISLNQEEYINANIVVKEPILIRGAGNITIFGVSNKFNDQFPAQLTAKLAPEEFRDTLKQINSILSKELENSFKWLVFGSIFCCCTLGCSFLPVIYMNKKAKLSINKLLEIENQRLYLKLGLKWKLTKIKCNSNSLLEYVLLIEFLPTILLYQPD